MAEVYNYNFFQVGNAGISEEYTGDGEQQHRDYGSRLSNFGALDYGLRESSDYTKVSLGFKGKFQNPDVPPFSMEGDYNDNPFVWGSTVKKVRNGELTIMLLGSREGDFSIPHMDVSDTKDSAGPFELPKHYPMEGWSSFGGRTGGPENYVAPGQ